MGDYLILDDPASELADWCGAVRLTVQAYAATAQGLRGWTERQRTCLQTLFADHCGKDRALRLAMGNFILTRSGLTGRPLASFNELSEAQASALVTHCFDRVLDELVPNPEASRLLARLASQLAAERPAGAGTFELIFD